MPDAKPDNTKSSAHDAYELPDELNFDKLKPVGVGIDALKHHEAKKADAKRRMIELAPDVADAFGSADEVNEALRSIVKAAQRLGGKIAG